MEMHGGDDVTRGLARSIKRQLRWRNCTQTSHSHPFLLQLAIGGCVPTGKSRFSISSDWETDDDLRDTIDSFQVPAAAVTVLNGGNSADRVGASGIAKRLFQKPADLTCALRVQHNIRKCFAPLKLHHSHRASSCRTLPGATRQCPSGAGEQRSCAGPRPQRPARSASIRTPPPCSPALPHPQTVQSQVLQCGTCTAAWQYYYSSTRHSEIPLLRAVKTKRCWCASFREARGCDSYNDDAFSPV